ncbi:unnamed protein product [Miscanthus lutarioriparius]|uniref:Pentatricopeptide repeat-containing protein n=1 Tax=Miscanthus lutarioriparius TaxID=422564 RepID=A0A811N1D4_9POAL|nr:unnamed protein product [Miscanthus lutarioriparius]
MGKVAKRRNGRREEKAAGLPLSPTAFSAAVARSGPDALPALHALAVASGLAAFAPVTNSLAARYAKGNSFAAAARVFASARSRDASSYNTILSATPDPDDALAFAARMLRAGDVRPDAVTLSLAAGRGEARLVRQLHALASRAGLAGDVFVGNALVTAYSRGGSLDAARKVFEEMPARDLVSWNALVCGLAQDGECPAEVIRVFLRMLKHGGVRPDRISVCSVIPACGAEGKLELGRQIHGFAVKLGVEGHVSIANVLVAMYYKCGTAPGESSSSWASATSSHGPRRDGVAPNEVTFVAMLSAMPGDCPSREGQMIHAVCLKTGLSDKAAAANSLITMYAKLRRMDDARVVFSLMPHPEIIAWNALISGYAQNEMCQDALEAFLAMVKIMKPNETTFASILSAVTAVETVSMAYGQMYHCWTLMVGLGASEYVFGALIDMYAKRGSLEESWKAFGETVHRSLIAWTAIISANSKHGNYDAVVSLFSDMVRSGVAPDGVVLLSLLTTCQYSGFVSLGCEIFDSMAAKHGGMEAAALLEVEAAGRGARGGGDYRAELLRCDKSGEGCGATRSGQEPSASSSSERGRERIAATLGKCGHAVLGEARMVAGFLTETEPTECGAYVLLSNIYAEKGDWGAVARVRRQMRERAKWELKIPFKQLCEFHPVAT